MSYALGFGQSGLLTFAYTHLHWAVCFLGRCGDWAWLKLLFCPMHCRKKLTEYKRGWCHRGTKSCGAPFVLHVQWLLCCQPSYRSLRMKSELGKAALSVYKVYISGRDPEVSVFVYKSGTRFTIVSLQGRWFPTHTEWMTEWLSTAREL